MEVLIDQIKEKFKNATAIKKGNSAKMLLALTAIMSVNMMAAPYAEANTQQYNNTDKEYVQVIQQESDNFNKMYTLSEQKEMVTAGYFIGEEMDLPNSSLKDVINNVDHFYIKYINDNKLSERQIDVAEYAGAVNKSYNFKYDDVPNFLVSSIKSEIPSYDELPADIANKFVAKAEKLYSTIDDKPYHSAEEAYDNLQHLFYSKVRNDGGVWTGEDMSFEHDDVNKAFQDFGTKGISADDVYELPNYLIKHETSSIKSKLEISEYSNDSESIKNNINGNKMKFN